jgi:hypothetical protein
MTVYNTMSPPRQAWRNVLVLACAIAGFLLGLSVSSAPLPFILGFAVISTTCALALFVFGRGWHPSRRVFFEALSLGAAAGLFLSLCLHYFLTPLSTPAALNARPAPPSQPASTALVSTQVPAANAPSGRFTEYLEGLSQLGSGAGDAQTRQVMSELDGQAEQGVERLSGIDDVEARVFLIVLLALLERDTDARRELTTLHNGATTRTSAIATIARLLSVQWQATHQPSTLALAVEAHALVLNADDIDGDERAAALAGWASLASRSLDLGLAVDDISAIVALGDRTDIDDLSPQARQSLLFALGALQRRIAARDGSEHGLQVAARRLTAALDTSEARPAPPLAATIHNELGLTHRYLAADDPQSSHFETAFLHYDLSLQFFRQAGSEAAARTVAYNLVLAMHRADPELAPELSPTDHLSLLDDALEVTDRTKERRTWSQLQMEKGRILLAAGEPNRNAPLLRQASETLRDGLRTAQTDGRSANDWALGQNRLADALQSLGEAEYSPAVLGEALQARRDAWILYQRAGLEQYRYYFEDRISSLETMISTIGASPVVGQEPTDMP